VYKYKISWLFSVEVIELVNAPSSESRERIPVRV